MYISVSILYNAYCIHWVNSEVVAVCWQSFYFCFIRCCFVSCYIRIPGNKNLFSQVDQHGSLIS